MCGNAGTEEPARFQSNIASLVRSNPDIADISETFEACLHNQYDSIADTELKDGVQVCVLPGTCSVM